jgi:hypothetical protein
VNSNEANFAEARTASQVGQNGWKWGDAVIKDSFVAWLACKCVVEPRCLGHLAKASQVVIRAWRSRERKYVRAWNDNAPDISMERVGEQALAVWKPLNRAPSRASLSRFGVAICARP